MTSNAAGIFPPKWKQGDHWRVVMKTQAPVPADLRPSYAEQTFAFRVTAVPDNRNPSYRIEVRSEDPGARVSYALYYREHDFSLERVTRQNANQLEETVIENGRAPFIYYERRLPIIPDFPVSDSSWKSAAYPVVQEIVTADAHARVKLERREATGSLRVVMEWSAGDPWWSTIECTENPPPDAPFKGEVVASGRLLKPGSHP